MWVSRTHYETLVENLSAERAKTSEIRERLAAQTVHLDWLMTHVNRLEQERSILTQARLGLSFPTPELSRDGSAGGAAGTGFDSESVRGLPSESVPLAQLMTASMDDVGDKMAESLGIGHDEQGFVRYVR